MGLTLDVLAAKHGEALLLRVDSQIWLIDGGPSGVYQSAIRPHLYALRATLDLVDDQPFPLSFVAVTHVDNDHVRGVLDLVRDVVEAEDHHQPSPWKIGRLWHNSFGALVGDPGVNAVSASLSSDLSRLQEGGPAFAARAASIAEGGQLADLARRLDLDGNPPVDGLVLSPRSVSNGFGGAEVTVIAPSRQRLSALANEWEKKVKQPIDRGALAEAAAYVDNSVTNLSSIALHVVAEGVQLLLTGDARGDDILHGLEEAQLLDHGIIHVDLLKVPHHGSDRNLTREFFEEVVADRYVISADGKYENPSHEVLSWIVDTQGDRDYEIGLTYADGNGATEYLNTLRTGSKRFVVRSRKENEPALTIALSQ